MQRWQDDWGPCIYGARLEYREMRAPASSRVRTKAAVVRRRPEPNQRPKPGANSATPNTVMKPSLHPSRETGTRPACGPALDSEDIFEIGETDSAGKIIGLRMPSGTEIMPAKGGFSRVV